MKRKERYLILAAIVASRSLKTFFQGITLKRKKFRLTGSKKKCEFNCAKKNMILIAGRSLLYFTQPFASFAYICIFIFVCVCHRTELYWLIWFSSELSQLCFREKIVNVRKFLLKWNERRIKLQLTSCHFFLFCVVIDETQYSEIWFFFVVFIHEKIPV